MSKTYKVSCDKFVNGVNSNIAYILGYLWADGGIYKNQITLELCKEDVVNILPIFESVGQWNYYERQRTKNGELFGKMQAKLNTSNKELVNFLSSMDYMDKEKGPIKILKHLGVDYEPDFWHGYFDGDGCLYIEKRKHGSLKLQFWSSIDQDWSSLIQYLNRYDISHKIWKYERLKSNGKTHRSSCFGVKNTLKIQLLMSTFYKGGLIGLDRKYEKYIELCNKISNRTKKYPKSGKYYY